MQKLQSKENNQPHEMVFLSLGSNLGDRLAYLVEAEKKILEHPSIELVASSSIRETPPLGYTEQPLFLNKVLKVRTSLSPQQLLGELLSLESSIGRRRQRKWGPRSIDIDILLYEKRVIDTPILKIPHPQLLRRPFLILLLVDLERNIADPVTGLLMKNLMKEWGDEELYSTGESYGGVLC